MFSRNQTIGQMTAPICLMILLPSLLWGQSNALQFRKVALTGEEAPGTEPMVVFGQFTSPVSHSMMFPRIDKEGRVSFSAFLSGPGVNPQNSPGMWGESVDGLLLVARAGSSAPGLDPEVIFRGFGTIFELPDPPRVSSLGVAFVGFLEGPGIDFQNHAGIWAGATSDVSLVVQKGDAAPGIPGATLSPSQLVAFTDLGDLIFRAQLGGVDPEVNETIWAQRSGPLEILLREGDPAPGTPAGVVLGIGMLGSTPLTFSEIVPNRDGLVAVGASLLGSNVNSFNDEAIFLETEEGEFDLVVREGDPIPGLGGVFGGGGSVSSGLRFLSYNQLGHIAFKARINAAAETAVFTTHRGALEAIVVPGEPAPSTNFVFGLTGPPVLSDSGRLAVRAAPPDDDGDPFSPPPFGIFWDQNGDLMPLVVPDELIPGTEITLTTVDAIVGFSENGHLAFRGPEGLFLNDSSGTVRLVTAVGETFDVKGDGTDLRVVQRVVSGELNSSDELSFRLDFTDGTSGHFTTLLGDPELLFVRGDCNNDGANDIADAIFLLGFLFRGGEISNCLKACDANDDGANNIADAIAVLSFLFGEPGGPLPPPFPDCGADTSGDALACPSYDH